MTNVFADVVEELQQLVAVDVPDLLDSTSLTVEDVQLLSAFVAQLATVREFLVSAVTAGYARVGIAGG